MAKKVQLPVVGGIRKVVTVNSNQGNTGTTIAGFEGQTLTTAQLAALLGVQQQKPNTQGGGAGSTAALIVGPGLAGGGALVGAVPLRLIAPIPNFPEEQLFDEPIGASSAGGAAGSSTLAGLSDVTLTSPTSGQVLAYNGSKWTNQTVTGVTTTVNKGASWVSSAAIVAAQANVVYVSCPKAGTIQRMKIVTAGGTGSCVLDVWKAAFASFPPTSGNSITASDMPTISSGTTALDSTLTGWTLSINAGDVLAFKIVSCSVFTQIEIVLEVSQ